MSLFGLQQKRFRSVLCGVWSVVVAFAVEGVPASPASPGQGSRAVHQVPVAKVSPAGALFSADFFPILPWGLRQA